MKTLTHPYLAALFIAMTARVAAGDALVDPTRPAHARASSVSVGDAPLRVEAVMHSEGRSIAIIGGRIVRAGDRVGSARIDAILPHGVRYTRAGSTHIARLEERALRVREGVTVEDDK